jgi:transitional endoplasmic reticulum ATPase
MTAVYKCPSTTGKCKAANENVGFPTSGKCPCCNRKLVAAPSSWRVTNKDLGIPDPLPEGATTSTINKAKKAKVKRSADAMSVMVPDNMGLDVAIHTLQRQQAFEEEEVLITEEVEGHPLDGARALMAVLKRRYGWVDAQSIPSFFGDIKPEIISLEVDYGEYEQVLWGAIGIPGIDEPIRTGAANKGTRAKPRFIFAMGGTLKRKYERLVAEIAKEVREELKENSIYKGKAFHLTTADDGSLDPMAQPKFMDVSLAKPEELILNNDVYEDVKASIFTPICKTEQVRKMGVPLKRGVLLYGEYGTGKTMTAHCTARLARENGWTFVYLDRPEALPQALQFCTAYGPTVIFAEDIDRVVGVTRDDLANTVLNTIDGIGAKGSDVMVILTTNHVTKIYPAMLRPGRLDHKINVRKPDKEAVARLIRLYAGDKLPDNADIGPACQHLNGQIPAIVREAVDRAKLYALSHDGDANMLTGDALALSARGMKEEIDLLETAQKPKEVSNHEQLGLATARLMEATVQEQVRPIRKAVTEIEEHVS